MMEYLRLKEEKIIKYIRNLFRLKRELSHTTFKIFLYEKRN